MASRKLATVHPGRRHDVIVAGLGKREDLTPSGLRVAAALAAKEAGTAEAARSPGLLPGGRVTPPRAPRRSSPARSSAPTASTASRLAGPRRPAAGRVESLTLLGAGERRAAAAETARICAEAQNRARDLQSTARQLRHADLPGRPRRGDRRRPRRGQRSRSSAASRSSPRAWAVSSPSARAAARSRG